LDHNLGIKITPEEIEYNYESSSYDTFITIRFLYMQDFILFIVKKDYYFYRYIIYKDPDINVYYILDEIEFSLENSELRDLLTKSYGSISKFLSYNPNKYIVEDFKLL
jgi:hypothetical protein